MKTNHIHYDFEKSVDRIDDILRTDFSTYKVLESIPPRDKLTFNNGFYVLCTALFVHIRIPNRLSERYHKDTLAKIYRSCTSEVVAVMNGNSNCAEINVVGDSIWGIFDTPYKKDGDSVLSTAAKISSVIDVLNSRYNKDSIAPITVGIGIDYGKALMIKAGYKDSGLDDIVWMGEVIDSASRLCSYGDKKRYDKELMVSHIFYNNLSDDNKKFLDWNDTYYCYHGSILNVHMTEWVKKTTDLVLC